MTARAIVAALVASLLLVTPVSAQDDGEGFPVDPTLTGPYLGASAGVAWDAFDQPGNFSSSPLSSLIVGYRGSEYISIEGEFEWLGGFQLVDEEIDGWLTSLGFRVHVPLGQVEPYLSYGGAILHVEGRGTTLGHVDATDFAIVGGAGVAYQWTDFLSVFVEGLYTWPISGVEGFDHQSIRFGLLYKFAEQ